MNKNYFLLFVQILINLWFVLTKAFSAITNKYRGEYNEWLFWTNLSRLNGLLVLLNISLFFLTGLVAHGYYYTCYSLAGLGVVGLGMIMPTVLVRKLWYYFCFLFLEANYPQSS